MSLGFLDTGFSFPPMRSAASNHVTILSILPIDGDVAIGRVMWGEGLDLADWGRLSVCTWLYMLLEMRKELAMHVYSTNTAEHSALSWFPICVCKAACTALLFA